MVRIPSGISFFFIFYFHAILVSGNPCVTGIIFRKGSSFFLRFIRGICMSDNAFNRFVAITCVIILLGTAAVFGYSRSQIHAGTIPQDVCREQTVQEVQSDVTASSVSEPETQPEPVVQSASLFMVGDALLHAGIENNVMNEDGTCTFTLLDRVGALARQYDLRYYNQETILGGDELGARGYPCFNGLTDWGDYMLSLGFNMTSLANNHALDQGVRGIKHSAGYWSAHPEMITAGTYLSQKDYDAIPIHEINGITFAFLSYTYGTNGIRPPEGQDYLVACYDGRVDELLQKVRDARKKADVVIVAMHWGQEYQTEPSESQITLAHQLSDAGADIIIGTHPHCIQPVDWINGRTICFYSLGNVVALQYDLSRIEMMAGLTIQKTTLPDGSTEVCLKDIHADLLYFYYTEGAMTDHDVIPFSQIDEAHLPDYKTVYEEYKPIITEMTDVVTVGGF